MATDNNDSRSGLKSISRLDELNQAREADIAALRQQGRKVVGYVCNYFPVEIVHALGAIPIRLALCSADAMERGKKYVGEFLCPFTKTLVGEITNEDSFYYRHLDFLSGAVMCQQAYSALRVLEYQTDIPVRFLWVPLNPPTPEVKKYFLKELADFTGTLTAFLEKELADSALAQSITLYNGIRAGIKKLYELQSGDFAPLSWSDFTRLVQAGSFLDPGDYQALLNDVIAELSRSAGEHSGAVGPKIILAGSIVTRGDDKLIHILEHAGVQIVGDDSCYGSRSFSNPISGPTLEAIAEAYLNSPPCGAVQDPDLENDRRLNYLLDLVRDRRADGVIYYCLRFCDPYAFKAEETKKFLNRTASVPTLALHSEYGDSDVGQLRTRVEAFVEIIN